MSNILMFLTLILISTQSFAVKLSDYTPFAFEPLFTNPVCATYKYDRVVVSNDGGNLTSKPVGVYCKASDEVASVSRSYAPQFRLIEWIADKNTKELYLAYLSFSSKNVANALCQAIKNGVKLNMVLDSGEDGKGPVNKDAESLKDCGKAGQVKVTYRGTTGGLGFAHNKIMIVNPGAEVVKIVFSSGNLTSGTSTNHENWNFVTTNGKSFFAAAHKCVIESMISAGDSKARFSSFLNDCRSKIKAAPETDIQVFFSPVDGKAALETVTYIGQKATLIEAMSHRLSGALASLYSTLLASGKKIKFILDDDMYWAHLKHQDIGRNTSIEAFKIYRDLIEKGMETRFMQTNQNVFQLQHNKFMVFTMNDGSGMVFNGAGNFTTAAFTKNFENFYLIRIPSVVEVYRKQYKKYFNEMASTPGQMPRDYILP